MAKHIGQTPSTTHYRVDLFIGTSNINYTKVIRKFEWKSIADNGFIVRAVLIDNTFDILDSATLEMFRNARQYGIPLAIKFVLRYINNDQTSPKEMVIKERSAIVTDFRSKGGSEYAANVEFIAIDPISFYINSGDCSGGVFTGKIGGSDGVISQVINKYVPSEIQLGNTKKKIQVKVDDTTDVPSKHWMMRQDPKTFIVSLLDWSCPFLKHKTSWLVAVGEDDKYCTISLTESYTAKLDYPNSYNGQRDPLVLRYGGNKAQEVADILEWETLHDSTLVTFNNKLVTSGISAISGAYLDRKTDWQIEQSVYVTDVNTEYKSNPSFGPDRGYSKPTKLDMGWTYIPSVPEHSGGELGIKYNKYISGRARQIYMDMLNMVMRIKITIRGEPRMFDCDDLGRTQVALRWLGAENSEAKFMDGNWLLYGWHHRLHRNWVTDLYLARLDYDATAKPGNSSSASKVI